MADWIIARRGRGHGSGALRIPPKIPAAGFVVFGETKIQGPGRKRGRTAEKFPPQKLRTSRFRIGRIDFRCARPSPAKCEKGAVSKRTGLEGRKTAFHSNPKKASDCLAGHAGFEFVPGKNLAFPLLVSKNQGALRGFRGTFVRGGGPGFGQQKNPPPPGFGDQRFSARQTGFPDLPGPKNGIWIGGSVEKKLHPPGTLRRVRGLEVFQFPFAAGQGRLEGASSGVGKLGCVDEPGYFMMGKRKKKMLFFHSPRNRGILRKFRAGVGGGNRADPLKFLSAGGDGQGAGNAWHDAECDLGLSSSTALFGWTAGKKKSFKGRLGPPQFFLSGAVSGAPNRPWSAP